MHRIYLDELGDARELPLPIAATVLTIVDENEASKVAQYLLSRSQQESLSDRSRQDVIDIVTAIMVYKFATLNRSEIKAMLGLNLLEEPLSIREAKDEGREEGRKEGRSL